MDDERETKSSSATISKGEELSFYIPSLVQLASEPPTTIKEMMKSDKLYDLENKRRNYNGTK